MQTSPFLPVFHFVFLFAGGHGGFYGNATGNYTLDSNFTGSSDEVEGVNRVIEQYIGSYALNTLGKTQKVLSHNNKAKLFTAGMEKSLI